jgi:hypothetical protein
MPSSPISAASNEESTVTTNRRLNLLSMLKEFTESHIANDGSAKGVEELFAVHLQLSPSRLSQIKGSRTIGDKLARQIETISRQPVGWLDEHHPEQLPSPGEAAFLALAREIWHKQNARGKRTLTHLIRNFSKDSIKD